MPKRTHAEKDSDNIDSFFDRILNASTAVDISSARNSEKKEFLTAIKKRLLSDLSDSSKEQSKPATDFTLPEAIETFGLKYTRNMGEFERNHEWDIEEDVGEEEFPTTPCIGSLLRKYSKNFDRTSEATCRTAIDFMLNECLSVMKGLDEDAGDGDTRPKTPNPLNDIKIYGEVSFTHKVISRSSPDIVVVGRVDYSIGRILKTRFKDAVDKRKRFFYSLLLVVEAKYDQGVVQALDQLIVYLASLRQSRLQRNRLDASVFGLASDGYVFIFVKISHDGTVMLSRHFDILRKDEIKRVLGCLRYVLEITANRSPGSTLERNDCDRGNDEIDKSAPPLDLADNEFMNPPVGEEDEEDDSFGIAGITSFLVPF